MSGIRESIAQAAGKVKKAGAALAGKTGILRQLEEEHAEVSALMMQVKLGGVETRRQLYPKIRRELLAHARAEQKEFYTVLQQYSETHGQINDSFKEHNQVEEYLRRLDTMAIDSDQWIETFKEMMELVQTHVDKEENEIFVKAKDLLTEDKLDSLKERYLRQRQVEMQALTV